MASLTPEDVANMALALLDEAPIGSLDQDIKAARLISQHYDLTREAELGKFAWSFAVLRTTIDGTDIGTGDCTLNWSYELPADCIRPLPITDNGEPDGVPLSWKQEGDLIYSNFSGPLKLRYIANLTDPNDWDALFTDVLVAALAVKVAHPLTHKAGMIDVARSAYQTASDAAYQAQAISRGGRMVTTTWAQQRGDWRSFR